MCLKVRLLPCRLLPHRVLSFIARGSGAKRKCTRERGRDSFKQTLLFSAGLSLVYRKGTEPETKFGFSTINERNRKEKFVYK